MIFVTTGTHEQQFNRLVQYVDELKAGGKVTEEIIIQTGFSTFEPVHCHWGKWFSVSEMEKYSREANLIITHGGPSSFMMPLWHGKIPIVVPRQKKYGEHVNDHQMRFCNEVSKRFGNIIVINDIRQLGKTIRNYDRIIDSMPSSLRSNNERFCEQFETIVKELIRK